MIRGHVREHVQAHDVFGLRLSQRVSRRAWQFHNPERDEHFRCHRANDACRVDEPRQHGAERSLPIADDAERLQRRGAHDRFRIVRAAALKALGTIGDRERSLGPVLARLVDNARVVRVKAAEVLVAFGIVELPGAAGEALRKAQDEYVVSLDMFPDVASNHAAKGWLEAERGNVIVARDALNKATTVEPNYAFPWVVKGVLLAREGKFADAVEMWKKARSLEPSYPNIDQLIAEAEKRK